MKYQPKPVAVEATQWFKNGDHPQDDCRVILDSGGITRLSEGRIVRYYRRPDDSGDRLCQHCGVRMHEHGWIDNPDNDQIVCPSDFVVTGERGDFYAYRLSNFLAAYQLIILPEQKA